MSDQPIAVNPLPELTIMTNGVPVLNQRPGAQFPFDSNTNGIANQWRFFIVTNQLPPSDPLFGTPGAATNIAFATFLPPNLSRPRFSEADIDLYVSADPNITNLVPSVLDLALRSRTRTGTESVVIESAANGAVEGAIFYAAVKAEDQQSANFGFFAISSSLPFGSQDTNGTVVINGYPVNVDIPDGAPERPQAGFMFAFSTFPMTLQKVVVTNVISHENGGDLFGVLDHDQKTSVLNANRSFGGNFNMFIYDDSGSGEFSFDTRTDSPGTLRNFVGEQGVGLWQLTMVDSAPGFTGIVDRLSIRLEPRKDELINGIGIVETIQPGHFFYTVVDVPADATNMAVCVAPETGPLFVYILRGAFPDTNSFDTFGVVAPPGDCINLGRRDSPPLSQGRYFIGVFNPGTAPVTAHIKVNIERDLDRRDSVTFGGAGGAFIVDDAVTTGTIYVPQDRIVSDLQVAVRLEHARVADLVMHLVSPKGTRILLAEDRGGPLSSGFGFGSLQTNVAPASSQGGPRANTNSIGPVQAEGTVQVDYNFFNIPDRLTIYYEGVKIFDSGDVNLTGTFSVDYGPGTATNVVVVMNEGNNPNLLTAWEYTATVYSGYTYAIFTENTNLASFPIKFAPLPFTNYNFTQMVPITNSVVLDEGFEFAEPCPFVFMPPAIFSGWEVTAGTVDVLPGDSGACGFDRLAYEGQQFLDMNALGPGSVQTNLPTVPGKDYILSFAYTQTPGLGEQAAQVSLPDVGAILISSDQPNSATNLLWQTNVTTFTATVPTNTLLLESFSD
ncbi:MAG TPA: proprotein convertase P-domain-containing protein, partial [Candidatus Dormibacteraeota bacterium]|nr:proprotein convertase P-domain-containing protein [Candidatus Dormibacteraeota bacterium]